MKLYAIHINFLMKYTALPEDNVNLHMNHIDLPANHINLHINTINLPLSRRAGEGGARREAVGG